MNSLQVLWLTLAVSFAGASLRCLNDQVLRARPIPPLCWHSWPLGNSHEYFSLDLSSVLQIYQPTRHFLLGVHGPSHNWLTKREPLSPHQTRERTASIHPVLRLITQDLFRMSHTLYIQNMSPNLSLPPSTPHYLSLSFLHQSSAQWLQPPHCSPFLLPIIQCPLSSQTEVPKSGNQKKIPPPLKPCNGSNYT